MARASVEPVRIRPFRLVLKIVKWGAIGLLSFVILFATVWALFPRAVHSAAHTAFMAALPRYIAFRSGTGGFVAGDPVMQQVLVPMRDGVQLATDVYLPRSSGPYPVILIRTPYTKREGEPIAAFFGRYGYAVVSQDVRGRHGSGGEFYPFRSEVDDGLDTTRWIKQQSWCSGRIGGFGGSYVGYTQWAAAPANPDLAAMVPIFTTTNFYPSVYTNGVFGTRTFLHWSLTSYGRYGDWAGAKNIRKGYRHFPLSESDDAALKDISFFNDWIAHPLPDEYWRGLGVSHRMEEIDTPALLIGGWYDFVLEAQLRDFEALTRIAGPKARSRSRILIGPWSHSFFNENLKEYGIEPRTLEVIPFEPIKEIKDWYDYALKGAKNGWETRPRVRAFVLGENRWRDERSWPPTRAEYRSYYLHSNGDAQTRHGGGSIGEATPAGAEPADAFVSDPRNPVPTKGGAHGDPMECGPVDQRTVEDRRDVLVYSSRALSKPLLVMGPVTVRLFASSSAADTDFTAKLVDVFPDGRALIVSEGIARARYRSGLDKPAPLKPGEVYPFEIRVGNTAVRFQAGHRIRLEIASTNAPRYHPNPNTGTDPGTERNPIAAEQRVFHDKDRASALVLPVIPE